MIMAIADRLVTADELIDMPDDGFRYELVRGTLRKMTPAGFAHGVAVLKLSVPICMFVEQHGLGTVCGAETGFIVTSDPDTVLAPDISFVRQDRLPAAGLPTGFWRGAPDLAVEVLSPSDGAREVEDKARAWLEAGARLVWLADQRSRTITVRRRDATPRILSASETLDGEDVLPGFSLPVADAFPP
jgi:Uma2 family endonuclease